MKRTIGRWTCALLALSLFSPAHAAEWEPERILQTERALYALGYHDKDCDTQLDDATRRSIESFQIANDLPVTGEPDDATFELLQTGGVTCHDYLAALAQEYADAPILQSGSSGEAVARIQRILQQAGYFDGACDGMFGETTQAAVRLFQRANGLPTTGAADRSTQLRLCAGEPRSWQDFLDATISRAGDSGAGVRTVQRRLAELGYFAGECTGSFGDLTRQAVARFQQSEGVDETGEADADTLRRLFSDGAAARRAPGALYVGCSGEETALLQRRLAALGYYSGAVTGSFGCRTELAVRLFQRANGLNATGEADETTRVRMDGEDCADFEAAKESLSAALSQWDGAAEDEIGAAALRVRGMAFDAGEEETAGFTFVQSVCAAAGLFLPDASSVLDRLSEPVEDLKSLRRGELLALDVVTADGEAVLRAVAAGDGSAVYATAASEWVLQSDLQTMGATAVHRWMGAAR